MSGIDKMLGSYPVVAAVRDVCDLKYALNSPVKAIFLMCGDIFSSIECVKLAKDNDKFIFLHVELIKGIGNEKEGIEYIARNVKPHGIVTTKKHLIKAAKKESLFAIQQLFIFDTQSYATSIKNVQDCKPDAIEMMPALMPRIINKIVKETSLPVVAAGLISYEKEIDDAINAGASAIAVGSKGHWK